MNPAPWTVIEFYTQQLGFRLAFGNKSDPAEAVKREAQIGLPQK